jgi:hypothetical protein
VVGEEKIAIYALDAEPKHASRQLEDGRWTHKVGQFIDLTATLTAFEGDVYGNVVETLKRPRKISN